MPETRILVEEICWGNALGRKKNCESKNWPRRKATWGEVLLQTGLRRAAPGALGQDCPTEFCSQGGGAQPVSPGQTVLSPPSRGGAQPAHRTVTHLGQLCLGSGGPPLRPRPTLPAAGTWGLRSADADPGATRLHPQHACSEVTGLPKKIPRNWNSLWNASRPSFPWSPACWAKSPLVRRVWRFLAGTWTAL